MLKGKLYMMTLGFHRAKLIPDEKSECIRIFFTAKYYIKPDEKLHLQPKAKGAYNWHFNIPSKISL